MHQEILAHSFGPGLGSCNMVSAFELTNWFPLPATQDEGKDKKIVVCPLIW